MDKNWIKVISITGVSGVICFLFSMLMMNLFKAKILNLLGSERIFYLLILLIFVFFIALLVAILKPKDISESNKNKNSAKKDKNTALKNKSINIKYNKKSTHNGDNNF